MLTILTTKVVVVGEGGSMRSLLKVMDVFAVTVMMVSRVNAYVQTHMH